LSARTGFALLAIVCTIAVWPLLVWQTVPAFQQDWTWPLSRGLAWQWLHAFVGLWDERSLGQGNALPWQTYAVAVQVALVLLFGSATGLAIWIAALQFGAGCSCALMLDAFGVRSQPARFTAAVLYALGPVAYTRIAAGHLAYLLAYALLPLAIYFARGTLVRPRATAAVALGITIGAAGCQIQFLAIAWMAVLAAIAALPRERGWVWRLAAAAAISVAIQLQALLPQVLSSTASLYAAQPALLSFEYNNSSAPASAVVMLGYFTRYYEAHALAGAFGVLYVLVAASAVLAVWASRRAGAYAVALMALGAVLTAGLYGPLAGPLAWSFLHVPGFAVFRDLNYFAALGALGLALALGLGLQGRGTALLLPALGLVAWTIAPSLTAGGLRELLVPRAYVVDALADMRVAAGRGAGRVLWLPAEEPLGPIGGSNQGRDFTAYGPAGNPSVSDDYQNPQLAYALATLRAGRPDWNAFAAMNVRYVVFRTYLRSGRIDNFGTGFPMAFEGLSDADLGRLLRDSKRVRQLRATPLSSMYELPGSRGATYVARVRPGARLFSELAGDEIALQPAYPKALTLPASRLTADPRVAWVEGTLGWRYRPWLPDSIYPFVWTLSARPLRFELTRNAACVLASAQPESARLQMGSATVAVRGPWQRYALPAEAETAALYPGAHGLSAVAGRPCGVAPATPKTAFVFASGYDAGWRAVDRGRLVPPTLADGWMMAWDARAAAQRLVYLPAYLQFAGFALTVIVLAAALPLARRADARKVS
jgi:hypothetical protein